MVLFKKYQIVILNIVFFLNIIISERRNTPSNRQINVLLHRRISSPITDFGISPPFDSYGPAIIQQQRRRRPPQQRPKLRQLQHNLNNYSDHSKNVIFKFYDKYGDIQFEDSIHNYRFSDTIQNGRICNPNDKFAILVHGWRESCNQKWMIELISKLIKYRGGCIICMDYSFYSSTESYFRLVKQFSGIANVLADFLYRFEQIGFDMNKGYMFGFSFGGQLVCESGRRIGYKKINEIDTCDMAGPGFDNRGKIDHTLAAKNVQCIHTSRDKGTRNYNHCNQDWRLGNCGFTQDAASDPPYGSHGLCPYMYLSSFENDFYAILKPQDCKARNPVWHIPEYYRMGYLENRKSDVYGELFALTSKQFPYNEVSHIRNPSNLNLIYKQEYDDEYEYKDTGDDNEKLPYNTTFYDDYS